MSVQAECEAAAGEYDYQLQNLKQLEARIAETDERIALIRESIRGLGCRSVAQALEPPAPDDSIVPRPSAPATTRAVGLLPWVLVVIGALPILFISLNTLKPAASNNRLLVARSTSSGPVTSGPMTSGPMTSGPMAPGPMTAGPVTPGPMTAELGTTAIAARDNQPALSDGPDTSSGPRQPEPSTVAPAQEEPPHEATAPIVIRSTLPPSEDDPSPVAPAVALSPPPIATPGTVDTTTTVSTPLLDPGQIQDAKRIQRRLTELGFLSGPANGTWGPRSRKALRDFRGAQGIGNSDTWDEEAQRDLFSATAARAPATGTFVGGWGTNADQCRSPVTITTRRAEAFTTTCQFNSTQRESANEWRIQATCADGHNQWSANVRLTLAGRRLTWASERGTVTYLRCPVIGINTAQGP